MSDEHTDVGESYGGRDWGYEDQLDAEADAADWSREREAERMARFEVAPPPQTKTGRKAA